MTSPTAPSPSRMRLCSVVSQQSGEDPIGSAWHSAHYVMVELPLPWKYNVLESTHAPAGLQELLHELWAMGIQLGTISFASDPAWSVPGMRRIFDYRLPAPPFNRYDVTEYLVTEDRVTELLRTLALAPGTNALDPFRVNDDAAERNIFVCTHGAIDACCATFGYPLYKLLRHMADGSEHPFRVWRCTHFGGHRFAATLLDMPQGRYWGHLEAQDLGSFIRRDRPFAELRRKYRGWAALHHPDLQVAEGAALAAGSWEWTDCRVTPEAIAPPDYEHPEPVAERTLTFAYDHPTSGERGEIAVRLTPGDVIQTLGTSNGEAMDAQQYDTTIVSADPPGGMFDRD